MINLLIDEIDTPVSEIIELVQGTSKSQLSVLPSTSDQVPSSSILQPSTPILKKEPYSLPRTTQAPILNSQPSLPKPPLSMAKPQPLVQKSTQAPKIFQSSTRKSSQSTMPRTPQTRLQIKSSNQAQTSAKKTTPVSSMSNTPNVWQQRAAKMQQQSGKFLRRFYAIIKSLVVLFDLIPCF